jgi:hypothetical protein
MSTKAEKRRAAQRAAADIVAYLKAANREAEANGAPPVTNSQYAELERELAQKLVR